MLKRLIRAAALRAAPYTIRAPEYQGTHRAHTWADALRWAECYPAGSPIIIRHRGRLISIR